MGMKAVFSLLFTLYCAVPGIVITASFLLFSCLLISWVQQKTGEVAPAFPASQSKCHCEEPRTVTRQSRVS
jgi:hypothetical protein